MLAALGPGLLVEVASSLVELFLRGELFLSPGGVVVPGVPVVSRTTATSARSSTSPRTSATPGQHGHLFRRRPRFRRLENIVVLTGVQRHLLVVGP
jgi:hypothetical protein